MTIQGYKNSFLFFTCLLWMMSTDIASSFMLPQFGHYHPSTMMSRKQQQAQSTRVVVKMGGGKGEAPQYTKRPGSVIFNKEVGKSSYLIRVKSEDDEPLDYKPGHVLALEIPDPENNAADGDQEWMRGPYTVTRVTTSDEGPSFDVLYKVVGKKTETFRTAQVGDVLQFGGKFKVPILEGINQNDGLERVVGISTGVGIGPLIGFAEEALSDPTYPARIDLFVAFREHEDVCCTDVLDDLSTRFANRFSWTPIISSEKGHISTPENLKLITDGAANKAGTTHYHMIGNGSMVNEWTAGLSEAGVPEERVTIEMYFNHKETPRPEAIRSIGEALKEVVLS